VLVALLSLVFALRFKPAFSSPNFYAEDGTVFIDNIIQNGILEATFTAFNGYLVVGQYLVADVAYGLYVLLGSQFSQLPVLVAVVSCIFLGLTASLPFVLFRKELGRTTAVATSFLLAFTPLYGSDYAVIGTIGNLKFAFLFWAVVFVVYRNIHYMNAKKTIFADSILLLCVLTNGPVVALLPLILWPYRDDIVRMTKKHRFDRRLFKRKDVIGVIALLGTSAVYVAIVYLMGIPTIPNYLNAPYVWPATDNIIYRATEYAIFFPFSAKMTAIVSIISLLVLLSLILFFNKKRRGVFLIGLYAIAVSTLAFVATRPGIGEHMLIYEKFPDQFFYAQSMVFVFALSWVVAPYVRRRQLMVVSVTGLFLLLSAPYGSSFGENRVIYEERPTIYDSVSRACKGNEGEIVSIAIYPNETWNMKVERDIACR